MNVSVKFILIQTQPRIFKNWTLQPKSSKIKQNSTFVCPQQHRMQIALVLTNQIFFFLNFNLKSEFYALSAQPIKLISIN